MKKDVAYIYVTVALAKSGKISSEKAINMIYNRLQTAFPGSIRKQISQDALNGALNIVSR